MKRLLVKKVAIEGELPDLEKVSQLLDQLDAESIDTLNWSDYQYQPGVQFKIAHNNREIFIKYFVNETHVKAEKKNSNEMVCEDSCVEFFVEPVQNGPYYNFEFNPIGTCLLGKGTGRHDSKVVDTELIDKIRRFSTMGSVPFSEMSGELHWELIVAIPKSILGIKNDDPLSGLTFRANFYKCGDQLTQPHYLTWNPVETENPDYHRPEFFGELLFE